ncbi:MAG: hypothetical protein ABSG73_13325 [Candidatus Aminicenantales bacterium]|jgi:hypothetical protein
MLTSGFYNFTEHKSPPMVNVETNFGGVCIDFTDDDGDELKIVLAPGGLSAVLQALDKAGYLAPWKKEQPKKAQARKSFEIPMVAQAFPA